MEERINRRDFFRFGLSGTLAFITTKIGLKGNSRSPSLSPLVQTKEKPKLIYRTLGQTGLKVTAVSMGVMNADNPDLVKAALDAGIILLDTAHGYQRGRNEEMIGSVIKGRPRDSFLVATKINPPTRDRKTGDFLPETSSQQFLEMLDLSLQRLGLDYVDILSIHNTTKREHVLNEVILEALLKAKKEGKTRFISASTHSGQVDVIKGMLEAKVYDVVIASFNFRQQNREEVRQALREAAAAGLGVIAMKTQAGVYWDKEKTQKINMKAALKWVLNEPAVHTAIPGFTTFDQLEEDLSVMADLTLTEEELKDLRLGEIHSDGMYCQGCLSCLETCPQEIPIPDLMRAYMYAFGYNNSNLALDLLTSLNLPSRLCHNCLSCRVKCQLNLKVKERLVDLASLLPVFTVAAG
ncbi:MAG: aldo/keto reductase [Candidatus Aminicenantes bacterium]|nr:aldo/keto reductase [Candidatus Aminicenantes bacterium]